MRRLNLLRAALVCFTVLLLPACYHPLEIVGEGDIVSFSGTRDCTLEEYQGGQINCSENEVLSDYIETYTGVARPGYQFRRWGKNCTKILTNECSFDVPSSAVQVFTGITVPPLQAVFRSTTNTGFNSLFIGEEFLQALALGLEFHANNAGFTDHSSIIVSAAGDQGSPRALWEDPVQAAAIKSVLDTGAIELFGMTYSPTYPTIAAYKKWVRYALAQNPDTRFFIAQPWDADPGVVSAAQYEVDYGGTRQQPIQALIDGLRAAFPGVDFYSVPDGASAVALYNLFDEGMLPDVTGLIGPASESIFTDTAGSPGDILTDMAQLVWLGAIYDVDLTGYPVDPGYPTDLRVLAQSVLSEQDQNYHAPDEVDVDTDGDGIWDRLDPNPTGKPNILMIVMDDLGNNDLAINNGNTNIDTPNLDQISQDGVRFTRHYGSQVCSPARAALLTGLFPERMGFMASGPGISTDIVTMPERLQQEGYSTWHIGKWHIGELHRQSWPDYQGFDHWFGFLNQWRLAGVQSGGEFVPTAPTYLDPYLESDSVVGQHYPGHLETILTDKAIEVIDDLHASSAAWFLNLWFYAPHNPITPSAEFAALYPDTDAGKYQALVKQMDDNIGQVISHLDAIGAKQDTIIVIVSDNGGTNAVLDNNYPYFGKKGTITEGGLRTPLLVLWPDAGLNGQVIDDTISIQDIYPTLMEAIGATEPPDLDGVSFYPRIDQAQPAPQRDLFWETTSDASYGVLTADGLWRLYQPLPFWGIELTSRLYDLLLDPTAAMELLPPPPAQVSLMNQSYDDWFRDVHEVQTTYTPGTNGGGVLSGRDFLRTPGNGWFTFAIGVPDQLDGQIAAQSGVWDMNRAGNTITANFGPVSLFGDITNSNTCHNVAITGHFHRKVASFGQPDSIRLALYIDEVEVDSIDVDGAVLVVPDPAVATTIGDPAVPSGNGTIVAPVVLSAELEDTSPWTLALMNQAVCNNP